MTQRPNIIFIMADDHAAKAISCYGAGINHTPHIDRLANEGMCLHHCYVTNSICTPSRASILTGTYNHINQVTTLHTPIDNRLPHVAKELQQAGYQTAMIGKWHLGEGPEHEPTGFDYWSVLPGQGEYFDPPMIEMGKCQEETGYVTDIITDKSLHWLDERDKTKPFFLMCHHKAPHRNFEPHPKYRDMNCGDIPVPDNFDDDYQNRALAAREAKMRIKEDMKYADLGLAQPEGGSEVGARVTAGNLERKIPHPEDTSDMMLIDRHDGTAFHFADQDELSHFKYQRYMKRYLQCIASIDENVGRVLDYLDAQNLTENTLVIYTSDQGFFLGEHGWFDKRFIYEESFQMPFLVRFPKEIKSQSESYDMACNVDFAPTFLDYAGVNIPSYMQGHSLRPVLSQNVPDDWQTIAYHRYWMHGDPDHNAYAHYGIRDHHYKLIYWYNQGLDIAGTSEDSAPPEWELFDLLADPQEMKNVYHEPAYRDIVISLKNQLEAKMTEIGDTALHP